MRSIVPSNLFLVYKSAKLFGRHGVNKWYKAIIIQNRIYLNALYPTRHKAEGFVKVRPKHDSKSPARFTPLR